MSSRRSFLRIFWGTFLLLGVVLADCFFPDGTADADGYPCNSTAGVVIHCCRTFEACLDKGVCYTQWDSQFYRRSCTDKGWGNGCPTVCDNVDRSSPAGMLPCSQGTNPTYCCDNGNTSCCSPSNEFNFIPGEFLGVLDAQGSINPPQPAATTITRTSTLNAAPSTITSDSSSTQSTSSSPTSSQGAATSQTLISAKSSDSSASRTVGLAVGIPLGVLLVGAIGGLFWFFNRRLNQEKAERTKLEQKLTSGNVSGGSMLQDKRVLEKGDGDAGHELPGFGEVAPVSGRYEMGPGKSVYGGDMSSSSGTRV